MGTKVASAYACFVFGIWNTNNKDKSLIADVIKQWKMYIDDCFILWKRAFEDLQTFANILNPLHKVITFKMTVSE